MNLVIYDMDTNQPKIHWEALGIRIGMLLTARTYCVGGIVSSIKHENIMRDNKATIATKLKLLAVDKTLKEQGFDAEEARKQWNTLSRLKHRTKAQIVAVKEFERIVNGLYETFLQSAMKGIEKMGLAAFDALSDNPESGICLAHYDKQNCELGEKYPLSDVFKYEAIEGESIPEPDVWMLYHNAGEELSQVTDLTDLAILPNINMLSSEQLLATRKALLPLRQQLDQLLPLVAPNQAGIQYLTGTWNIEEIQNMAAQWQQTIDQDSRLKWAKEVDSSGIKLQVGHVETKTFWTLLNDKKMIPEPTWNVLLTELEKEEICPHIPVMVASTTKEIPDGWSLTEAQTTDFKRKTLDID